MNVVAPITIQQLTNLTVLCVCVLPFYLIGEINKIKGSFCAWTVLQHTAVWVFIPPLFAPSTLMNGPKNR